MNDSGNGTYHYDYQPTSSGTVTIQIFLLDRGVEAVYFENTDWSLSYHSRVEVSDINFIWGRGTPVDATDSFSAIYIFYLLPWTQETYNVYIIHNNDITLTSTNAALTSNYGATNSSFQVGVTL
jgi:hypothetical protein